MKARDLSLTIVLLAFTVGIILYYNYNTEHISDKYYQQIKTKVDSIISQINASSIISEPQKKINLEIMFYLNRNGIKLKVILSIKQIRQRILFNNHVRNQVKISID